MQLSFNLGGLFQANHTAAYARAHAQEVAGASYEPASRLAQQRQRLAAVRNQARQELALVERELDVIKNTVRALDGTEAATAIHQRDRLTLDQLGLGAQRALQGAYLAALQQLLDAH